MDLSNNNIPNNLSECFDILRDIMKDSEECEWFKSATEEDAISNTHHGIGEWIRNNWKLWDKKNSLHQHLKKLGLWHPDDMSSFILTSYHRFINEKDLDLIGQVNTYINYWTEYEKKFGPIQK